MLTWLRKRFDPSRRQLDILRDSLKKSAADLPIDEVYPIFAPASFFALGNWVGPFQVCKTPGLGMTWAVFQPEQTMRYVDRQMIAHWESNGVDWRTRAMANLRAASNERPFTHEFRATDGRRYAVAMMHEDANGPARALLDDVLSNAFPEGYLVGLPEMSCGVAVSKSATPEEAQQISEMVARCHANGTRPLVEGLHEPSQLQAPG